MTGSAELTEAIPLPDKIGQYTILCQLDQGGMATLYLGRALGLGGFERLFAIKLIHEHLSREKRFVNMFLDEARLSARISHPNVVSVYEIGIDRGRHFIAMDYINGETLALALQHSWGRKQAFPIHMAAYLMAHAAEGLHAAHELRGPDGRNLNVIHRDVAPSNLMVGYDGIIRVMDFGVAKARDQLAHTKPGTIKGTLAYMAPEHVRSKPMDRRADLWSLGVVLWETLVGKRLFKGRNDIETTERLLRRRVVAPSQLREEIPLELEQIVLRALERDPALRFGTARELGETLQEFLARERVRIGPSDVESFMMDVFGERAQWRQELQQLAPTARPSDLKDFEGLADGTSESDAQIELLDGDDVILLEDEDEDGAHAPFESGFEEAGLALNANEVTDPLQLGPNAAPPAPLVPDVLMTASGAIVHTLTVDKHTPLPELTARPSTEDDSPQAAIANAEVVGLEAATADAATLEADAPAVREPTQVIRTERALQRARLERAEKEAEGRTFVFAWRERAEQDPDIADALREARGGNKTWLLVAAIVLGLGGLSYALVTGGRGGTTAVEALPLDTEVQPAAAVAEPSKPVEPIAPVQDEAPTDPPPTEAAIPIPEPEVQPSPEPKPAVAKVEAPAEPKPVPMVTIEVELRPESAELFVNGAPTEDRKIVVPRSDESLRIEALAKGYVTEKRTIKAAASRLIAIELKPSKKRIRKSSKTKPEEKKKNLLIFEGGDL